MVDQLTTGLGDVVDRTLALVRAGRKLRIVTDHGWLLMPGGLPTCECVLPVIEVAPLAPPREVRIVSAAWQGLRLRVVVSDGADLRALRTLDLSGVGDALLEEIGIGNALYLYDTINRIDVPPSVLHRKFVAKCEGRSGGADALPEADGAGAE